MKSSLSDRIKQAQKQDSELQKKVELVQKGKLPEFNIDNDCVLRFGKRLSFPCDSQLKNELLCEAHSSPFSGHPSSTNMYKYLQKYYWWGGMKRYIADFTVKCLTCH